MISFSLFVYKQISRSRELDHFFVLACDGVWDVFNNDEAAQFLTWLFKMHGSEALDKIAEHLTDCALQKGSRDNISAIVVALERAPRVDARVREESRACDQWLSRRVAEIVHESAQEPSLREVFSRLLCSDVPHLPPGESFLHI